MATKVYGRCPTCVGAKLMPGHLWLGGDDFLVCPTCNGTQQVEIVEEVVAPKERTISISGVGTFQVPKYHRYFEEAMQ